MKWYLEALRKYAVFSGRSRRREYWLFVTFSLGITVLLVVIEGALGITTDADQSVLASIYSFAMLVPTVAVGVRRMHDVGRSGWWLWFPIVNFIFLLQDSEPSANAYGDCPKDGPAYQRLPSAAQQLGPRSSPEGRLPSGSLFIRSAGVLAALLAGGCGLVVTVMVVLGPCRINRIHAHANRSGKSLLEDQDLRACDFEGVNLSGAKLMGPDLTGVDLRTAALISATLSGARLDSANLQGTDLSRSTLISTTLAGADLSGANLSGATLVTTTLAGARLVGARLVDVELTASSLRDADLSQAILTGIDLRNTGVKGAKFNGAELTGAMLDHVTLAGASMEAVSLERAHLVGTNLEDTHLNRAQLGEAVMTNASLLRSDLSGAVFTGTKLNGAKFVDAKIARAVFSQADLTSADLRGVDFSGVDLSGAILDGADLSGATNLTDEQLASAASLSDTRFDSTASIRTAFQTVCDDRTPVAAAAPYVRGPGVHKLVVLPASVTGEVDDRPWQSKGIRTTELVACVSGETEVVLQTCSYQSGPSVTRYRYQRPVSLIAPRTGHVVASTTLRGSDPRACSFSESYSLERIEGERVRWAQIYEWLQPFVAP